MHHFKLYVGTVTLLILAFVCVAPAQAQATRTWVSGTGVDSNDCSRTAPCKTFAGAIAKTAAHGEINCLDPGGFGGVTITEAITIDCQGTLGSVLVSGTNGITVAAGATDEVALKGLDFEGLQSGTIGISFVSGAVLRVDDVEIRDFTESGIQDTNSKTAAIYISNTQVSDCGAAGIALTASSGTNLFASIANVKLVHNVTGLGVNGAGTAGTLRVTFRDSFAAGNTTAGVSAVAGPGLLRLMAVGSAVVNNNVGLTARNANSEILVSDTTITGNQTGLSAVNSGKLISFKNNNLNSNVTADGAFTSTVAQE